jgi:hypothetical protein
MTTATKTITVHGVTAPLAKVAYDYGDGYGVVVDTPFGRGFLTNFAGQDAVYSVKTLEDAGGNLVDQTTPDENKDLDPGAWNINVDVYYRNLVCFADLV